MYINILECNLPVLVMSSMASKKSDSVWKQGGFMMDSVVYLKKQDIILNHKQVPFQQKLDSIIKIWKTIVSIDVALFNLENLIHIVDWAILHTLNLLLAADWNRWQKTYKLDLTKEMESASLVLVQKNNGFHSRCEKVIYVLKNPWSNPVLMRVMRIENVEIDQEIVDLFRSEETHLISLRLNKLCESCCEDLALNLVRTYFKIYEYLKSIDSKWKTSQNQNFFMLDIRLVLLYKYKHYQEVQEIIEGISLEECFLLVKRFARKRVDFLKVWKYSLKIAMFTIQIRMNKIIPSLDEPAYLQDFNSLLESYINFCSYDNLLPNVYRYLQRLSSYVSTSITYKICEMLNDKHTSTLRSLTIELFIRALTYDMNQLEKEKLYKSDKVIELTKRLASKFGVLATFFEDFVEVARECLLTAFSLDPTREYLDGIEDMARKSGWLVTKEQKKWKCKLHPPALPSDEITWKCPECQEWMCKPVSSVSITPNTALNEAIKNTDLSLPGNLCDDLIICLSSPRYRILNWSLPWDVLHRLCIMYHNDPKATMNLVTELKFIDIDYSIFDNIKQEPIDECSGIEKGYEKYLSNSSLTTRDQDQKENHIESGMETTKPHREMKTRKTKKQFDDTYDPNSLTSLKRYIRSKESKEDILSVRRCYKRKGDAVGTVIASKKKRTNDKNRAKKKQIGCDENYDPNSLTSLKKYVKSKQLRKEISSTRKYYKKSFEASQFYNTRFGNPLGTENMEKKEQQTNVVENAEKSLQSFVEGEEYDPNSIESLRKCVDLEKSKNELLSKFGIASRSDLYPGSRCDGTVEFEYD